MNIFMNTHYPLQTSIYLFSYGLTRVIFFSFLAYNFSLRIFSNSHKSNFSSCLRLQVISKSKVGVRQKWLVFMVFMMLLYAPNHAPNSVWLAFRDIHCHKLNLLHPCCQICPWFRDKQVTLHLSFKKIIIICFFFLFPFFFLPNF
jgi:hypothetical protein